MIELIPQFNHTVDTLIVSLALVLSALIIYRGLKKIEKKLRPESATELRERLGLPKCNHTWDKIPTVMDYAKPEDFQDEDEYGA